MAVAPPCVRPKHKLVAKKGLLRCLYCGLVPEKNPFTGWRANKRMRLLQHYGFRCFYCNIPFEHAQELTIDHYIPRSLGGGSRIENLRPCCERCNQEKANLPPEDFLSCDWLAERRTLVGLGYG